MEELIKEAKWLYFQIENTQEKLVKSRLRNEKDNEHTALMELETEMCATLQFLKCLIERKDNIVDLGEVWHDIKEEPEYGNPIVYVTKLNKIGTLNRVDKSRFDWYIEKYAICKWAYMKDLLPKGGDRWIITK